MIQLSNLFDKDTAVYSVRLFSVLPHSLVGTALCKHPANTQPGSVSPQWFPLKSLKYTNLYGRNFCAAIYGLLLELPSGLISRQRSFYTDLGGFSIPLNVIATRTGSLCQVHWWWRRRADYANVPEPHWYTLNKYPWFAFFTSTGLLLLQLYLIRTSWFPWPQDHNF